MSVAVMKKLTVLAHADDTETILRRLIRLKCVEVKSHPAEGAGQARLACEEALAEAERRVEEAREALVPLHKYSTKKKQLFVPQRTVSTAAFVTPSTVRFSVSLPTIIDTANLAPGKSSCINFLYTFLLSFPRDFAASN